MIVLFRKKMSTSYTQVTEICNGLAMLATRCTMIEFIHRVAALGQLHEHWTLGHSAKVVCLTCEKDGKSINSSADTSMMTSFADNSLSDIVEQIETKPYIDDNSTTGIYFLYCFNFAI
jgi:hypothetical protein